MVLPGRPLLGNLPSSILTKRFFLPFFASFAPSR
jgi:hypothetical protein